MTRLFFRVAFRNLTKNKIFSFINIAGLAAGMAMVLLISLWIWDEISFNHYHHLYKSITILRSVETFNGTVTTAEFSSVPIAAALTSTYPESIEAASLTKESGATISFGDINRSSSGLWVQPGYPHIFSLRMKEGNERALKDPSKILLCQSLANAVFKAKPALGQTIRLDNQMVFTVGGVYEDLPENSSLHGTEYLLPWDNAFNPSRDADDDWTDHHFQLFVLVKEGINLTAFNKQIRDLTKPHISGAWEEICLFPLDQWHLYNETVNGKMSGGRIEFVRLFAIIGGFVLLLACINFMNLSTARSAARAREVGIRKAIGSRRRQLIGQFLGESLLTTGIAMLLSLLLAQLFLGSFNLLADKTLSIPYGQPVYWMILLLFTLITGFVAGIYPAFYLSGFKPVKVLKGVFRAGPHATFPRKFLVVTQFTVSIVLMIGTAIVYKQVAFAKLRPPGYSKDKLIVIELSEPDSLNHYEALRNELISTGTVENMAESSSPSTEVRNDMLGYDWKGRDPQLMPVIGTLFVTTDFGKTMHWQIAEGRDFSRDFPADSGAFIINETAAKFMGFDHPVGQTIRWHNIEHPIVGMVKDMVMTSPYDPVKPTFFTLFNRKIRVISIRINAQTPLPVALPAIAAVMKKFNPGVPFEFEFTEDAYAHKFSAEDHIGRMVRAFSILAILISLLGLFGLASYTTEQRSKEIGLRKVLGASVFNLWRLLSKEFAQLIGIACAIAIPLSIYFAHEWLEHFQYRTPMEWWIFAGASIGALLIALCTVSYQAVSAARKKPVNALRAE